MQKYVPDVRTIAELAAFSDMAGSIGVYWWAWCARRWRAVEMLFAVVIPDVQGSLLMVSECSHLQKKSL